MNKFFFPVAFGVGAVKNGGRVCCVIKPSGKIIINSDSCAKVNKKYDLFLIRGIVFLFFGIYNTVWGLFAFNDIYNKNGVKILNKSAFSLNVSLVSVVWFIVAILGAILAWFLLGELPLKLSFLILPKNFDLFLKRFTVAIIKCLIVYLAFLSLKPFNTFSQYYKFNSAIKNYQDQNGEINFLTYFICSVFLCVIVLSVFGLQLTFWYGAFINIFIAVCVFSVNYELFGAILQNKHFRWCIFPFYFLIKQNPSQNETKCVNIVLKELQQGKIKVNMKKTEGKMPFSEAYVVAKEKLQKANRFEQSDLDFIFCEVLNKNRAEIKLVREISNANFKSVLTAVEKRAKGQPISKIFGKANFYGYDFKVTNDVLSPRMDTEVLVEQVIKYCLPKTKVLDIGTGSGAIAITINKQCGAKVLAVDISDKALEVAKHNAKLNDAKVSFKKSNLFDAVRGKFDIIVSNPPYIPSGDIAHLDDEVKCFDPLISLDGGESGLVFYEKIIDESVGFLNKNGKIFFEVGVNQAKDVKKLLQKNFKDIKIVKDYNKIDRVVFAILK